MSSTISSTPNYPLRRRLEHLLFVILTIFILVIIAFPAYWLVTIARGIEQLDRIRFESLNPIFLIAATKP